MTTRDPRSLGARGPRKRSRLASRRPVSPERFARVALHLPALEPHVRNGKARRPRVPRGLKILGAVFALGAALALWWSLLPEPAPEPVETVYLIEELPPPPETPPPTPPDPAPPKAQPEIAPTEPPPPPQFGMQAEALSEAGEMAVATGNTLMTEADTVVKAPVAELPPSPEFFDNPPRIRSAPPAEYPPRALDLGLEGVSRLRIEIDETGRVTRVSVEKSGGKDFDRSAIAAARGTRFEPFTRGGKAVPAVFLKSYEFILE